jgi:predicted metal-dependent enzyme (double-stranded beta helix superfamily)
MLHIVRDELRVLDVTISPGDATLNHTHACDTATVGVSRSSSRNQPLGGAWRAPEAARRAGHGR